MSKLQDLIRKLCPEGVEFKRLGEVCEIYTGGEPPKDTIKGNAKDVEHPYPVWANGKDVYGYSSTYKIDKDATVISSIGANTGAIYFRRAYFTPTIRLKVLVPKDNNLISKYLYYYLSTVAFVVKSSSVPNMNANEVRKLEIPLPPLEVQNEIVRILDAFTSYAAELQAELHAELQARKEQYEYYRNKLLTFDENDERVEWMMLGEVCNVKRGKRLTTKDLSPEGEYPVYHGGIEAIGKYTAYNREGNSVMIINVGASAGTIGFCNTKFWSSDGCFCFEHNSVINQKYLYFVLQTLESILKSKVRKAGIPTLDNRVVERLIIPILPIPEQKRIVSILDKFESLVNDLSEGLPAEIAAVQEQYEYYRDKLLTFKRKS